MRYVLKFKLGDDITGASLELLNGILTGEVDLDSSSVNGADILTVETHVIPAQTDDGIRIIKSISDKDRTVYVNTVDKVIKGNLFLTLCKESERSLTELANDVRTICEAVNAYTITMYRADGPAINVTVAYGTLKETQTDDYNPLDKLPAESKTEFCMMSPNEANVETLAKNIKNIEA